MRKRIVCRAFFVEEFQVEKGVFCWIFNFILARKKRLVFRVDSCLTSSYDRSIVIHKTFILRVGGLLKNECGS